MKQSGRARCRWRSACAFPRVQPDVVMISACGKKRRRGTEALGQFKAEHVAVEGNRTFQIRHLQMHVADLEAGMDGCLLHGRLSLAARAAAIWQ